MIDSGLYVFISFLIAALGAWFISLWLKPRTDESIISMILSGAIILFLVYGLITQNPNVAIFHK